LLKLCLKKSTFFKIWLKKSKIFENLVGKYKFFKNLPEKSKFLKNLPGKIEILFTRIHDPQISNQIDAAEHSGTEDMSQSIKNH